MSRSVRRATILLASSLVFVAIDAFAQDAAKDVQTQIDALKAALPKFAIPMREVGDRFQNMYFAAKGGNWALAAYMSKYMNGAINPAMLHQAGRVQSMERLQRQYLRAGKQGNSGEGFQSVRYRL